MPYNEILAEKVRKHFAKYPAHQIKEKKMFGGIAFIFNEKMCVNVSGENLMCRFDPALHEEVSQRTGYLPMIMRRKSMKGYCYVEETGSSNPADFEYWMNLCINFNTKAKISGMKKR